MSSGFYFATPHGSRVGLDHMAENDGDQATTQVRAEGRRTWRGHALCHAAVTRRGKQWNRLRRRSLEPSQAVVLAPRTVMPSVTVNLDRGCLRVCPLFFFLMSLEMSFFDDSLSSS